MIADEPNSGGGMLDSVTVLVHSRNRPFYLWASLDSLFRATTHPHKFVFVDMASDDPLVRQVVTGFERRGMFSEVVWLSRNNSSELAAWIRQRLPMLGSYVAYVQSDVIVPETDPCWLSVFVALMRDHPRLAMLGSVIDKRDFVDLKDARRLEPECDEHRLHDLIKWFSPERIQDPSTAEGPIFLPHNPAGRLLMLRTAALREVGISDDSTLNRKLIDAGYETGIATAVRHRHLSLLHIFDYPRYDYEEREAYMRT